MVVARLDGDADNRKRDNRIDNRGDNGREGDFVCEGPRTRNVMTADRDRTASPRNLCEFSWVEVGC